MKQAMLDDIEKYGLAKRGKAELVKFLNDDRITKAQAIKAKCYSCMGYYSDGGEDCKILNCPLYPFMPYRTGGVQKSRVMSEATKAKIMASKVKTGG